MNSDYETKRDATADAFVNSQDGLAQIDYGPIYEDAFKAGADWWAKEVFWSDGEYSVAMVKGPGENPAEDLLVHYNELKAKLEIATGGLKQILYSGNLAILGKWDDTELLKDLAYKALVQLGGEK